VVKVKDLATVELGGEIRQGAVTMSTRDEQGKPFSRGEVLAGIVFKRKGANTNATIEGVYERLPLIDQALPDGVKLQSYYDQADLISKAVSTVSDELSSHSAGFNFDTTFYRSRAHSHGVLGCLRQPYVTWRPRDCNRDYGRWLSGDDGEYLFTSYTT